jgi:hypothetical protein
MGENGICDCCGLPYHPIPITVPRMSHNPSMNDWSTKSFSQSEDQFIHMQKHFAANWFSQDSHSQLLLIGSLLVRGISKTQLNITSGIFETPSISTLSPSSLSITRYQSYIRTMWVAYSSWAYSDANWTPPGTCLTYSNPLEHATPPKFHSNLKYCSSGHNQNSINQTCYRSLITHS